VLATLQSRARPTGWKVAIASPVPSGQQNARIGPIAPADVLHATSSGKSTAASDGHHGAELVGCPERSDVNEHRTAEGSDHYRGRCRSRRFRTAKREKFVRETIELVARELMQAEIGGHRRRARRAAARQDPPFPHERKPEVAGACSDPR
jgi:hypothetical protein